MALSVYSQVKVIGQVKEPQALPYHEGMTVLEALLGAKGMSQFAAGNRARISRMVNGKQQDIKVKLDALVNNGDLTPEPAAPAGRRAGRAGNPLLSAMTPEIEHVLEEVRGAWRFRWLAWRWRSAWR